RATPCKIWSKFWGGGFFGITRAECALFPKPPPNNSTLRGTNLGADRAARLTLPQVASTARPRAGAWDVSARCFELRGSLTRETNPSARAETKRREIPHRAGTSQSRPSRLARAHLGSDCRARDLRRTAQPLVRARAA